MRRKFATNLIFLLTANLLVKPYWIFGIDRVVQNKVGPDAYGTYFAVFNYSFLLNIILDFGINNFNNRAISRDNKRLGEYLLNLLTIKFFLSFIYFALTFATAIATGFEPDQMWMLFFLGLNQVLLSYVLYLRSNIAALQLFKTDSIISILDRLLAITFCVVALYVSPFKESFNVMWFIYAQVVALFITAIVALIVLRGRAKIKLHFWKFRYTRKILMRSAPFALLALLMGIYYRIDAVMIDRMLPNGEREAGIYAASFRLLDAVNQFGYLFATLLLPMFAGMIRRNESVRQLVKFSSELMYAGSIVIGVACFAFRNEIMHLLYHDSNVYWADIFGWLMLNFIPISSIYIFGTLLTAHGSLKVLNFIALGGMLLNILLNMYLIPHYGAFGATIATLITQLAAAVAHIVAANRQFGFNYEWKDLLKLSLFGVLSYFVLLYIQQTGMQWMLSICLGIGVCGILSIVMQLVPVNDFIQLIRSRTTS